MNAKEILSTKLKDIIALEYATSIEAMASYIFGEMLGDYDDIYTDLNEENATVQRIGTLASDLDVSNGNDVELTGMWTKLKCLVVKFCEDAS